MDAATIAESLEGRWEGRQWRCRCPVHGGHSLMVRDGEARPIWHCFGGCDGADIGRELDRLGLLPSDEIGKEVARQKRLERNVERAIQIVHIAHEATGEIVDRFGRDYRWARTVLRNAGYILRYVPERDRQWPTQRVVVAKNRPVWAGETEQSDSGKG